MKILLSQDKFTVVGPKDYAFLMQWKWYHRKHQSGEGYAARTDYTNKRTIHMHRVILERMGFKNFVRSDHINRDGLDNRRCNLRPATNRQSNCNRGKQKNNTSGYIGVSWERRGWRADIRVNRKHKFLGYFNSSKKAAKFYNKAALKYHGKFAVLNTACG